jgi:hypothetical protein
MILGFEELKYVFPSVGGIREVKHGLLGLFLGIDVVAVAV